MQVYRFGENQFYQAENLHDNGDTLEDLEFHVNRLIGLFTKRRLFRDLLELYGYEHNLRGYTVLNAHGNLKNEKWIFFDGKRPYIVQNWVDKMDGNSLVIILACCSPKNYDVHSETSVILHPKAKVSIIDLWKGNHTRIFVPGEGYLEDNYYKLRKVIEQLR